MANKKTKAATTGTEVLRILWEEKYFWAWKKIGLIEEHLGKKGYHFSGPEMGNRPLPLPFFL